MDQSTLPRTDAVRRGALTLSLCVLIGAGAWLPFFDGPALAVNRSSIRLTTGILAMVGQSLIVDDTTIYLGGTGYSLRGERIGLGITLAFIALALQSAFSTRVIALRASAFLIAIPILIIWRLVIALHLGAQNYSLGLRVLSPGWHILTVLVLALAVKACHQQTSTGKTSCDAPDQEMKPAGTP